MVSFYRVDVEIGWGPGTRTYFPMTPQERGQKCQLVMANEFGVRAIDRDSKSIFPIAEAPKQKKVEKRSECPVLLRAQYESYHDIACIRATD
jgi:hypothetical protein